MKKASLIIVGILLLILTACGDKEVEPKVLGTIGDKDITDESYLELLQNQISPLQQQEMILNEVMKSLAEEDVKTKIFDLYKADIEATDGVSIEDYNLEAIEENAELQAGMVFAFQELGYVTEEQVKEKYEENKTKVKIDTIVLLGEEVEYADEVEALIDKGENIKEELEKIDPNLRVDEGAVYNYYTIPFEFKEALESKEGELIKREEEGAVFITKTKEVDEATLEELETSIIVQEGLDQMTGMLDLFNQLEEKGFMEINKELKGYLEMNVE